jgi:hypothetical protein
VTAIGKLNDQFNMVGENRRLIPRLLLRLEVKDIAPEYFAGALALALNSEKNRALLIVGEVRKSVLAPVEKDFADYGVDLSLLDRFEIPIVKPSEPTPKVLEEIRPAAKMSPPTPTTAVIPVAIPKSAPLPAASKTASLDEFSRIGTNKTAPSSPVIHPPKPVVLQTESIPRPILNAPNFKVPTISQDIMGGERVPGSLSQKAAVVEIGGMPTPKATPSAQTPPAPKVTVVRFGSENSKTPITPPKPEATRTVTEITSETLKATVPAPKEPPRPTFTPISQIPVPSPIAQKPQPPIAPASPMTPKPMPQVPKPAAQPEKVIQKDYSASG